MSENEVFELECGGDYEQVPNGLYKAKFLGLERVPPREFNGKQYGESVRLNFEVMDTKWAGHQTGSIGPIKPHPKNTTGALLQGMGLDVSSGRVSIKDYIGRTFNVSVDSNKAGRPVVRSVHQIQ